MRTDKTDKETQSGIFKLTHKDLVNAAYRWCSKNASCGVVFKELYSISGEIPDVIGFGGWGHSVLIECKTSRSDFFAEFKKPHRINGRGMGKYRLFCVPTGLIKESELPEKWGLIYVNDSMKTTAIVNPFRQPYPEKFTWSFNDFDSDSERHIMYSALRRLHLRGHTKEIYNSQNQTKP